MQWMAIFKVIGLNYRALAQAILGAKCGSDQDMTGHTGKVETSLQDCTLLKPGLTKTGSQRMTLQYLDWSLAITARRLRLLRRIRNWSRQHGACGVPAAARREFGEAILEATTSALLKFLGAFREVPTSGEAVG